MLKIITYNCHGLYSSIQDIIDLCDRYDLIFLQEIWLFKYDLSILCNMHPLFEGFGCSAIDESNGINHIVRKGNHLRTFSSTMENH